MSAAGQRATVATTADRRLLIDGKWTTERDVTGVQRYANGLRAALDRAGLDFDLARPAVASPLGRTWWEQTKLPRLARQYEVLLCPANMAPIRVPQHVRLVLILHCLRFLHHPAHYSAVFVRWYRFAVPRLLDRAAAVLTASRTMADEIAHTYPSARCKVRVAPPGASEEFVPEGPVGDPEIGSGDYWVYIGDHRPAKNLATLLDAMARVRRPHRVVLAGVSAEQLRAQPRPEVHSRLVALGHVKDTERLAAIVRGAVGLLAPSRYESFGLPTLEAMATGTAVIASDIAAHREVCRDAAVLLPPSDSERWASEMERLATSSSARKELAARGLVRAAAFDWDLSAREVIEALESV